MAKFQSELPQVILETRTNGASAWVRLNGISIRSLTVASRVNRLSSATVVVQEADSAPAQSKDGTKQQLSATSIEELRPGSRLRISFKGTSQPLLHLRDLFESPEPEILFQGIITEHSVKAMRNGHTQLTLEARHDAVALAHVRQSRVFAAGQNGLAEMAATLLQELGLDSDLIEVEGAPQVDNSDPVIMFNVTAWDFLMMQAECSNLLVHCSPGKVTMMPTNAKTRPTELLSTSSEDLFEYELSFSGRRLHNGVETLAWDSSLQQLVQESLTAEEAGAMADLLSMDKLTSASEAMLRSRHPSVPSPGTLPSEAYRQSLVMRSLLSSVRGSIVTRGSLDFAPGQWLGLRGFGSTFNGGAFISAVTQQGSEAGWLTQLELGLQPDCFSRYNDVVEEPVNGTQAPMRGLQIGIIQETEAGSDSSGMHRMKVLIPYFGTGGQPAGQEMIWARIASPDAGEGHGMFFRPSPGDEVILGFLNEDPRSAIVLGSLTSGAGSRHPAVYASQGDARSSSQDLQGILTRSGIRIELDELSHKVTIQTPGKRALIVSDEDGEEQVTLRDAEGNEVSLGQDGITLTTGERGSRKPLRILAGDVEIDCEGSFKVSAGQDFSLSGSGMAPNLPEISSNGGSLSLNGQQIKLG
jgi:hypothetical protein